MRRGFTIIEAIVALVVMAILGTALARMLISDSRFVSRQHAMLSARQAARAAMNSVVLELRMVTDDGVIAANFDSVSVRVPYAFGMTCRSVSSSAIVAALVPPDSLTYATATAEGMAWLDPATGQYTTETGITVSSTSDPDPCEADSIRVVPGGWLVQISDLGGTLPPSGRIFYLFQTVTYRFGPSAELSGRRALWRTSSGGYPEELVAPFDTSAGFACLVGPNLTVEDCPPPPPEGLDAIRGVELRLVGASEYPPQGSDEPQTFELVTRVAFLNKVN